MHARENHNRQMRQQMQKRQLKGRRGNRKRKIGHIGLARWKRPKLPKFAKPTGQYLPGSAGHVLPSGADARLAASLFSASASTPKKRNKQKKQNNRNKTIESTNHQQLSYKKERKQLTQRTRPKPSMNRQGKANKHDGGTQ